MKKSPQAFRTISEVAKVLDVPAHVLRFWETRFSQIKPVKRGGGRRYYRPEDVDLIRGIRNLLYTEGLTIKGAQKILRDKGLRHVVAIGRGEDAQIAEADALWDEPGVSDMAEEDAPVAAPSDKPAPKPAAPKVADPRQSSLFGDDDLAGSIIKAPVVPKVENAFVPPIDPSTTPQHNHPEEPTQLHSGASQSTPAQHTPAQPPQKTASQRDAAAESHSTQSNDADHDLDQDALKRVFGKLKALRASMDDD